MRFLSKLIMSACVLAGISVSAQAETITAVNLIPSDTHMDIRIDRNDAKGAEPKIFTLGGQSPRLVIDWVDADFEHEGKITETGHTTIDAPHSLVRAIRHARKGEDGLRIVFDLRVDAEFEASNITDDGIVLRFKSSKTSAVKKQVEPVVPQEQAIVAVDKRLVVVPQEAVQNYGVPVPRVKPSGIVARAKKLIVIDPGHGGRDPGAIGAVKGTHEKDITFSAAKSLKKILEKTGRYEVILTRNNDSYVKHADRIKTARVKNADLFISIHADSTKSKTARGASVYTLADRAKNRSKRIVNSQNWIMDVDLSEQSDPVGDILVDLAQRKTLSQSTMFADVLIKHLSGSTRLIGNTHRRAGYYVLLAPDVPAVLLELGFLSNGADEKLLRSKSHRDKMMKSVSRAIDSYFRAQTR